jgi:RHS repeat-associated protein
MPTDKQYTGQQVEPGDPLGLYNYKARMYSTVTGRFTSADTWTGDGLNRYAYTRNNPLTYRDATGHGVTLENGEHCPPKRPDCENDGGAPPVGGNGGGDIAEEPAPVSTPTPAPGTPSPEPAPTPDCPCPRSSDNGGGTGLGGLVGLLNGLARAGVGLLYDFPLCGCGESVHDMKKDVDKVVDKAKGGQPGGVDSIRAPGKWEESPGPDFEWRGSGPPGSKDGSWYNPKTDQSLHPDPNHGSPQGPHYDYKGPDGEYRIYPDGRKEPK